MVVKVKPNGLQKTVGPFEAQENFSKLESVIKNAKELQNDFAAGLEILHSKKFPNHIVPLFIELGLKPSSHPSI